MGGALPPAQSPFTKTELEPLGTYTKRGSQWGLKFPDGRTLINFCDNTSYPWLNRMATLVNAEIITVKGTWTFVPDPPESDE